MKWWIKYKWNKDSPKARAKEIAEEKATNISYGISEIDKQGKEELKKFIAK